jgi:hypothetical protein
MQGRIKGTLLNAQDIVRDLVHTFRDRPSMLWTQGQRSEDKQIKRALWQIDARFGHPAKTPFRFYTKNVHLFL